MVILTMKIRRRFVILKMNNSTFSLPCSTQAIFDNLTKIESYELNLFETSKVYLRSVRKRFTIWYNRQRMKNFTPNPRNRKRINQSKRFSLLPSRMRKIRHRWTGIFRDIHRKDAKFVITKNAFDVIEIFAPKTRWDIGCVYLIVYFNVLLKIKIIILGNHPGTC